MMNVAVWGIGSHAEKNTIPAISEARGVNLGGLLSRDIHKSKRLAEQYDCAHWESPEEMLTDHSINCVYIASPVSKHFKQTMSALKSGKHVLCEKTLTEDHGKAVELFSYARKKQLLLFECLMYLHHQQFKTLQSLLAAGEIGEPFTITSRFGFPHLETENIRYRKDLGGGASLDAGVYPLSAIFALLREEPLSVTGSKFQPSGYDVDTSGSACLQFGGGKIGHASWAMGVDYHNEIEIWGSDGTIKVNRAFSKPANLESEIELIKNGKRVLIKTGTDNHFINMFEAFSQSKVSGKDSLDSQDLSLAVSGALDRLSHTGRNAIDGLA